MKGRRRRSREGVDDLSWYWLSISDIRWERILAVVRLTTVRENDWWMMGQDICKRCTDSDFTREWKACEQCGLTEGENPPEISPHIFHLIMWIIPFCPLRRHVCCCCTCAVQEKCPQDLRRRRRTEIRIPAMAWVYYKTGHGEHIRSHVNIDIYTVEREGWDGLLQRYIEKKCNF